jgi:hypothetical protein
MRTWGLLSALVLVLAGCGGTSHAVGKTAAAPTTTTTISGPKPALTLLLPAAIQRAAVLRIAVAPSAADAALARRLGKMLGVRPALQRHATGVLALDELAGRNADIAVAQGATRAGVTFVDRTRGVAVARDATVLAAAVRAALNAPS